MALKVRRRFVLFRFSLFPEVLSFLKGVVFFSPVRLRAARIPDRLTQVLVLTLVSPAGEMFLSRLR
jgi:hypothetical protein